MGTITLPNFRVSADVKMNTRLKDGGVYIDWNSLTDIKVWLFSNDQKARAGRCDFSIDETDGTKLVCRYSASKPQYLGVNKIIVQATYQGATKTYDKPVFNFVRWTAGQAGEQITMDDPEVDVEIVAEDVSSSILDEATAAALAAADRAEAAAEAAEHMVDIHTGPAGKSPYKGENGNWFEWDEETGQYVDTGTKAKGETGDTPDISIGTVTTVEPGEPAAASMTGTPEAPVLNLSIPKGAVGATPNFTIGTVTTGEPGTPVVVTLTGTAEAPVLNITIPQGMQGNTGSSVAYPFELVNNLTTDDATKALSAAQGVVLDGKISQLRQKVDDISTGKYYGYYATSADLPDNATVDGFAHVGSGPTYTIYNCDGGVWTSTGITVNQSPVGNDEDIDQNADGKLQFANRTYNSLQPNGMGYKILRKNATFASQVTDTNTIYEIRYDFSLGGGNVNVPNDCVLRFNGGKLSNGNIHGRRTRIDAGQVQIFDSISFTGVLSVERIFPQWFGAIADGTTDSTNAFQKCFDYTRQLGGEILVPVGDYRFDGELKIVNSGFRLLAEQNARLYYYGTSNFITLGDKATQKRVESAVFDGLFIRAYDANSGDIFRLEYAAHISFQNMQVHYGENAFNTDFADFVGAFYIYFKEVGALWQKKNGFRIIPRGSGQANDIHFLNCRGNSAGNPVYGVKTNTPDPVDGNGFYIGGTAVSIKGSAAEANNGYGIKIDNGVTINGCVIDSMYFETNLLGTIFIGKTGYKGSIDIGAYYDRNSALPVIELTQLEIGTRGVRNFYDFPRFYSKDTIVSQGVPYYALYGKFSGLKFPATLKYRVRAGHNGTYCQLCIGIMMDGEILRLVGRNGFEAKTITAINNGVVTFDSPASADYSKVVVVSEENPLFVVPVADLLAHPIPAVTFSGKYPGAYDHAVAISAGDTTFNIPTTMSQRNPNMKVGDVVYLYKGDYREVASVGLTTYTDQTKQLSIPSAIVGSAMEKYFCALFITNIQNNDIPFDYFYGYSD